MATQLSETGSIHGAHPVGFATSAWCVLLLKPHSLAVRRLSPFQGPRHVGVEPATLAASRPEPLLHPRQARQSFAELLLIYVHRRTDPDADNAAAPTPKRLRPETYWERQPFLCVLKQGT